MGRVAVFLDGGYLDEVLRKEFGAARIDYARLVDLLAGGDELLRAHYYHCLPYQSSPPTPEEAARFGSMQRFCSALNRLDRFQVKLGKLAHRGCDGDGKPIFIQKRVDILIGVDLVRLSVKSAIDRAVLVSGDSDLLPAIQVAKDEGVIFHLYHGGTQNPPHRDLWDAADNRTRFTQEMVNSILRT